MKRIVTALAATTALVLSGGMPAGAGADRPGVKGGGFIRSDKTKTTLTISAFDNGPVGDSGQAQLVIHTPGSAATPVHISISCVTVVENVATAAGTGTDGNSYLLVVKDNGQGAGKRDEFGYSRTDGALVFCLSSLVQSGHGLLGTADGGNFQVTS